MAQFGRRGKTSVEAAAVGGRAYPPHILHQDQTQEKSSISSVVWYAWRKICAPRWRYPPGQMRGMTVECGSHEIHEGTSRDRLVARVSHDPTSPSFSVGEPTTLIHEPGSRRVTSRWQLYLVRFLGSGICQTEWRRQSPFRKPHPAFTRTAPFNCCVPSLLCHACCEVWRSLLCAVISALYACQGAWEINLVYLY